jgi:hypothetical protein
MAEARRQAPPLEKGVELERPSLLLSKHQVRLDTNGQIRESKRVGHLPNLDPKVGTSLLHSGAVRVFLLQN